MFRRVAAFIAIFVACSLAQPGEVLPPLVLERIDHHVRQYVELSPGATVRIGAPKPAADKRPTGKE